MHRRALEVIALVVIASACGRTATDSPEQTAGVAPECPPLTTPGTARPCARPGAADVDLGGAKAVALAAREDRVCALLDDGGVMCWGDDGEERGSHALQRSSPSRIAALDGMIELALGRGAGCGRRATGRLSCWGYEVPRSLGAAEPSRPGVRTTGTVAVGFGYACAIRNRAVICGGSMIPYGKFPRPATRIDGISNPVAIGAGTGFACALEADGGVVCWGDDYKTAEQRARESYRERSLLTRGVRVAQITGATALAAADYHGCALLRGGEVACWTAGQPPSTVEALRAVDKIAVGDFAGCALHSEGSVSCWILDGDGPYRAVAVDGIHDAIEIAAGGVARCALRAGGRVRCWGGNESGQLGIATMRSSDSPVEVCGLDRVTQVATAYATACALRESGDLYCWGADVDYLGDATANSTVPYGSAWYTSSAVPRRVPLARKTAQVVAFDTTACALDVAGKVACWGLNPHVPLDIEVPTEPVISISLDKSFGKNRSKVGMCAVSRAGSVTCNGARVPGVEHATRVSGADAACADVMDGHQRRLVCWGLPWFRPDRHCEGPGCLLAATTLLEPLACGNWLCARTRDGDLYCRDEAAQPIVGQCTPWPPDQLDKIKILTPEAGRLSCAVRPDGLVACSGDNAAGQLGTGRMGCLSSPAD